MFLTSGILFAVLWGNVTPPEIPLWLNVGLCRNETGAKQYTYGTVKWLGALDIYAVDQSGCKTPPTPGLTSISKAHVKHFVKQFPYYPRLFATDLMEIRDMNISLSRDGRVLKTWSFSSNAARRLSTSGRKLLKGGSSSGGSSPSRRSNRGSSSRHYRTAAGAAAYSTTRYGGRRRRAIEATAEGIIQAVYSPVEIVGERLYGNLKPKPSTNPYPPLDNYRSSGKRYRSSPSCGNYDTGCEVEIFSSLSLYELNGNGIFFDPEKDESEGSQDFYEVHTSVHARYDEFKAATSAAAGYTTEFPKIFVTFATDREDPNAVLYGFLCISSFVMLFLSMPLGYHLEKCCKGHNESASASTAPSLLNPSHNVKLSFNSSQTYDVPSRYTENVDQVAKVQPLQGDYYINKYNDDYTTTDVCGTYSGRVTRLNLHTNDVASIRGLHRMPLLSELTLTNNLTKLNGLNQSRSIRKLVADDNNLGSLMGLQSTSLVSFRARSNDIRSLTGAQAPSFNFWIAPIMTSAV